MSFIHLHSHSVFSFHYGTATIPQLVAAAKGMGMPALALTDTDRMSGLILFYNECRAHGIKPILGAELTEPAKPHEHIVLLCRNAKGYADLCEVITKRQCEKQSFTFASLFAKPWPNFVFITSSPALLDRLCSTPNRPYTYGELVRTSAQTREHSAALEQTARRHNVPLVATNNVSFVDPHDWETHKILVTIGANSTLSRLRPNEYAPQEAFFKSSQNMEELFFDHPEAVANTAAVAKECSVSLALDAWIMPQVSVPAGYTPISYLTHLALHGLKSRYGGSADYDKAEKIQRMELEVIEKLGYPSYFLIVKEIRDWANEKFKTRYRKPHDCAILRGSAANSITFYNLGVSELDPIKYDLYFQRFLNEDRASPPDADLDFGWDEREQVFQHLADKYGQDRIAVTGTTNHFRWRAAFRETAKVFGYSDEHIGEIQKSWKTRHSRLDDGELRHIATRAAQVRGKPRFMGQHPGGVLITNDPIWRRVACEYSGGEKNRIITQIDMHNGIDGLGLIKFDILGNGSLSVLRDTLAQLEEQRLADPGVWNIDKCCNDPLVREIIRKGRTRGIFYIESPAQMRLNTKAQAETFEEITITSSLIRPAGTAYTKMFVERHRKMKMGIKEWDFLHPSLEPILGDSHDVCAFQEDVTKICHQVAGLSYKKADAIRKQMNSSHEGGVAYGVWEKTALEFVAGCMRHSGLTRQQALTLWERVSSFSGFSFCKSHSASYAQLSFKCTYLKAYYPAQFLAAVVSNRHGFYTADVYLDEARRWGVRILSIDINMSDVKYYGKHAWIRPGFMHIRGVREAAMQAIVRERQANGRYRNLIDFVKRVPLHKKEIEQLVLAGAFDGFGLTQPELLYALDDVYRRARSDTPGLFDETTVYGGERLHPGLNDYTLAHKCVNELGLLGFMLSGNILDILDIHPAARNAVAAADIGRYAGKRVKIFGRPITQRIHEVAASGDPMLFMTLEDKTECVDVLFWPAAYEKFSDVILESGPFEIWGRVSQDWGTYTVVADTVRAVEWSAGQIDFEIASKRLAQSFKKAFAYADVPVAAAA